MKHTERERALIKQTAELMRAFGDLELDEGRSHETHRGDVVRAVHDIQRVIAMRLARRSDPEAWR